MDSDLRNPNSADVDITVGFLMQIDKLVQLIESPIFIRRFLHF